MLINVTNVTEVTPNKLGKGGAIPKTKMLKKKNL